MVTKHKVELFLKYQDYDNFARIGKKEEKELIADDWGLIDSLIHDIYLVKNELVSSTLKSEIEIRICKYTEGDEILIKKLFTFK